MSEFKMHYTKDDFVEVMAKDIYDRIKKEDEIVIFCIGTDRSTGDALGPIVGTLLEKKKTKVKVYGTLHEPVHAKNLVETAEQIKREHKNALVIAVDACLGYSENVGKVYVKTGTLNPGAGVAKDLPKIGDIAMYGIVNISGSMEFMVLQNTRLSIVYDMAECMANALSSAIAKYNRYKAVKSEDRKRDKLATGY